MAVGLAREKLQPKPSESPEYSIYIYHHPANHLDGWNDWEKRSVTQDLRQALKEAEALYASKKFEKVEVKEKSYDQKRDQAVDKTLKIFKPQDEKATAVLVKAVGLFVLSVAALFIAAKLGGLF